MAAILCLIHKDRDSLTTPMHKVSYAPSRGWCVQPHLTRLFIRKFSKTIDAFITGTTLAETLEVKRLFTGESDEPLSSDDNLKCFDGFLQALIYLCPVS